LKNPKIDPTHAKELDRTLIISTATTTTLSITTTTTTLSTTILFSDQKV